MKYYAIRRVLYGIATGLIAAAAIRVSQQVYGGAGGEVRMSYWGIAFLGLAGGLVAALLAEDRSPGSLKEELLGICERFITLPRLPRRPREAQSHDIPIRLIGYVLLYAPVLASGVASSGDDYYISFFVTGAMISGGAILLSVAIGARLKVPGFAQVVIAAVAASVIAGLKLLQSQPEFIDELF